jgi:hypothetical protein
MKTIRTEEELLSWLYPQLFTTGPMIEVSPGLPRLGNVIFEEVMEFGCLARYDTDLWTATFEDVLIKLAARRRVTCGRRLIYWLSAVYAEVAGGETGLLLPIACINDIALRVLRISPRFISDNGSPESQRELRLTAKGDRVSIRSKAKDRARGLSTFRNSRSSKFLDI